MDWRDTLKDELPEHNQEVQIHVDGEDYIALYDSERKFFFLENSLLETRFFAERQSVYWKEWNESHNAG